MAISRARRRPPSDMAEQTAIRSISSMMRQVSSLAGRSGASCRSRSSSATKARLFSSSRASSSSAPYSPPTLARARTRASSLGEKPKAGERSTAISGMSWWGLSTTASMLSREETSTLL